MDKILVREPVPADEEVIAEVNRLVIADLRKVNRPNQKALEIYREFPERSRPSWRRRGNASWGRFNTGAKTTVIL